MKTWLILQGILLMTFNAKSQDPVLTKVRHQIDSSITQIQKEPDPDKRVQMLIEIHHNPLQGYPQVYLETGQRLNKLSQEMHDPRMEANSWSFMGQGYRLTGNYVKALECHQKALALAETTGNKAILAMALNEMGHIYKDREENEKALNIYFQALQNARESLVEELPVWPSMNIGVVYFNLNELDSALFYTQIAYDEFVKIGAVNNLAYVINNMASIYSKMGNKDKAMSYFHQALLPNYSTGSVRYPNLIFIAMAEHYRRFNQEDSSLFYARKAVEIVENTPFSYMSIKPARLLMDVYQNTNADSAIKYLKIYQAANDSLFSNRTNYQLQMMALEADQRKQELASERTRFQNKIKTNILLGVLFTIGLVAFILYRNNKQKHKANLQLKAQKEEIESTLSQLKQTQTQLIQSEKMASLGEMTAGIAHEIQNPLNFVNNFSEVNCELIIELKDELTKGNTQSANDLADNIKENEEKIVFHGKRADSIVKSMLLHSRSGSGQKELTDINAMVDEYVRLAYHGMRARDKSFNVDFKTVLDPNLPKINVVQQDIGRVLLNLINNAFQALATTPAPKSPKGDFQFVPAVTVTTKRKSPLGDLGAGDLGAGVEIKISDNGPGIPDSIKDKIFQPFFTTKPAGQGTGLGLSLSYDIIKAHGGEIKVDTREGEGTTFIIILPA